MSKSVWYIVGAVVLIALGIGLSSNGTKSVNSEETIKVAYPSVNVALIPFMVAYSQGYFTDHNVVVEPLPMRSSDATMALLIGQVDVVISGPTRYLIPISENVPIKFIGPMSTTPLYLMVRPDGEIKTFSDLEGKVIAASPGGGSDYKVRKTLKQEGIDANTIEFVSVEKANKPIALMLKRVVDAIPIGPEKLPTYLGLGAVIHDEWKSHGHIDQQEAQGFIVIRERFKSENPVLVERFIDAIIEGHRFIKSNPEEASIIASTYLQNENSGVIKYSPDDIKQGWASGNLTHLLWEDPEVLAETARLPLAELPNGLSLTVNDIFDLTFQKKLSDAQKEIYPTS